MAGMPRRRREGGSQAQDGLAQLVFILFGGETSRSVAIEGVSGERVATEQ
jgi:hypothetical protein